MWLVDNASQPWLTGITQIYWAFRSEHGATNSALAVVSVRCIRVIGHITDTR